MVESREIGCKFIGGDFDGAILDIDPNLKERRLVRWCGGICDILTYQREISAVVECGLQRVVVEYIFDSCVRGVVE